MHKQHIRLTYIVLLAAAMHLNTCMHSGAQSTPPANNLSTQLDKLIVAFPVQTGAADAETLYRTIIGGGRDMVKALCSRIAPPSDTNNAAVRFAMHGVIIYSGRPGADKERQMISSILEESLNSATDEDLQDFFLEQLRFVADNSQIPAVSRFLQHARLSVRATAIMVNLGGKPAEKALLTALPVSKGACTMSLLRALGDLGSSECIKECEKGLNSTDIGLQRSALYTLSRSGAPKAGDILKARLQPPPAGISAEEMMTTYLSYIERLSETGESKQAINLSTAILSDKTQRNAGVRCRALSIVGMTHEASALPVLSAALNDSDKSIREQASILIAGLIGRNVTTDLLASAKAAKGKAHAALLNALSRRQDLRDTGLFEEGLKSDEPAILAAAVDGLRRIGSPAAAKMLLTVLDKASAADAPAIIAAVKSMTTKPALAEIAEHLSSPSAIVRETAVTALTEHRARDYAKQILRLTSDTEPRVSASAFTSMSVLAGEKEVSAMIDSVLASTNAAFRKSASDTIASAAARLSEKERLSQQLLAADKGAAPERKSWIMSMLPAFGGKQAMDVLTQAASSSEENIRDAAVRALAAWSDDSALPVLQEISSKAASPNHRVLAMRGAVRLLRESAMPSARKLELYGQLIKTSPGANEMRLIISGVSEIHETGALELLCPLFDKQDLASDTALAMARVACPADGKGPALPASMAESLHKACDLIKDPDLKKKLSARLPKLSASAKPPVATKSETPSADDAGFVPLFNEKDLAGWIGDTKGYVPEDGKIVCRPGGNLYTEKEYANFIFRFEFKLTPGANNGLGIRTPAKGDSAYAGMELQILDDTADKYKTLHDYQFHGSIYGIVAAKRGHQKPVGEWNYQEVIADGPKIKITLNGTVIVDADLSQVKQAANMHDLKKHPGLHNEKGHIGFLGHGSVVEFRNIRIKELGASPAAPQVTTATNIQPTPPEGFTALFNGKDLTGWKGLLAGPNDNPIKRAALSPEAFAKAQAEADDNMRAHWKTENGILEFDGKGRSLCTGKDYKDFEMFVDWKIKEHGDSGIYVRGSPQIQIWDPAKWPVGSGGLYNNQKNPSKPTECADKPIGEWNTFHIRMVGEKVTVDLNGKRVVDNVVLENYWDRKQPIFPSGQIELQNHGNNLYFRNIYIREL